MGGEKNRVVGDRTPFFADPAFGSEGNKVREKREAEPRPRLYGVDFL